MLEIMGKPVSGIEGRVHVMSESLEAAIEMDYQI